MRTFKFEIIFICDNTNEQKTTTKEYKALDYIQAKQGMKDYCNTNKTYKDVLSLRALKFGLKSVNLLNHDK